ncbi:MAG TPA: HDOD domain-containing protein [Opitutaceae bacterium]|nr:HDOD domain-containing protein [Opitutaceae bacterium]
MPHANVPSIEAVCEKAARLPCSPVLLPRLSKALANEATTADELEAIIVVDPALASATLRLANSAFFRSGSECETVSEAILRLGFREIYRLAVTTLGSRWFNHPVQGYGWEPGDFCRHSLCVAVAAEKLAEQTGKVDKELAYTAGLIQGIGKLAIAFACGEFFGAIRDHQRANNCPWWQAEREVLGYHQSLIGARLLEIWKFPENLTEVVRHSDHPAGIPPAHRLLMAHLHAAKFVATAIGPGVAEDGFLMELDAELLLAQGFAPEKLIAVQPEVLEAVTKLLREQVTHGEVKL